jgi:hypothetical protein
MPKPVIVTLPDDLIAECDAWAREVVAHYTNDGEHPHTMPWTADRMTDEELRQWLASRKDAGRVIDIETCEIGHWYHNMNDEYGIRDLLDELPEGMRGYTDKTIFVRSSDSNGWVSECDLPEEKWPALKDRIKRSRLSGSASEKQQQEIDEKQQQEIDEQREF